MSYEDFWAARSCFTHTLPRISGLQRRVPGCDSLVLLVLFTFRCRPSLSFTLRLQVRNTIITVNVERRVARQGHDDGVRSSSVPIVYDGAASESMRGHSNISEVYWAMARLARLFFFLWRLPGHTALPSEIRSQPRPCAKWNRGTGRRHGAKQMPR